MITLILREKNGQCKTYAGGGFVRVTGTRDACMADARDLAKHTEDVLIVEMRGTEVISRQKIPSTFKG